MPPSVVAVTTNGGVSTNPFMLAIHQVAPGDMLVVGVTLHAGQPIVSVVDSGGHSFTSANARALMNGSATEIWYEPDAPATVGVQIQLTSGSGYDVWVMEIANVHQLDTVMTATSADPPGAAIAETTTTMPDELVVGFTMLSTGDNVSSVMPPFIGLTPLSGNGGAYYFAPSLGAYGPSWNRTTSQQAYTAAATATFY